MKLTAILNETFNTFLYYNDHLNPKLWTQEDTLRVTVRTHLLDIVDHFKKFVGITIPIKDIVLIGSSCDYSHGPKSDIDVHIIVDLPQESKEYKLLLGFQNDWKHIRNIKIKNHPVEIYFQAKNEKMTTNTASFSLKNNKWLKKPKYDKRAKYEIKDADAIKLAKHYIKKIDHFINQKHPNLQDMLALKNEIKKMRKKGLISDGEYSIENLAFKIIRNNNKLTKLLDKIHKTESDELSL